VGGCVPFTSEGRSLHCAIRLRKRRDWVQAILYEGAVRGFILREKGGCVGGGEE